MTTLDLNAYGVTEMSHAEKVDNDGGLIWFAAAAAAVKFVAGAIAAAAVVELVTEKGQVFDDFKEGYESNRQ